MDEIDVNRREFDAKIAADQERLTGEIETRTRELQRNKEDKRKEFEEIERKAREEDGAASTAMIDEHRKQLDEIFNRHAGHVFWVTTSRRTPSDIISLIKRYPFEYMLIWSQDAFNPLPAFIATCDHLYLTADSASMISEAVSFGSASVNLLPVNFHAKSKLNTFTQQLCKEGYVNCINETMAIKTPKIQLQDLIKNRLMNQF